MWAGVFLALLLGFLAGYQIARWSESKRVEVVKTQPTPTEIPQQPFPIPHKRKKYRAVIAIIIDDIGYRMSDIKRFSSLPYPVTLSVIPFTPFDITSAKLAHQHHKPVMLHIPMEPNHTSEIIEKLEKKTKGMLFTYMDRRTIINKLSAELKRVPYAVAANNHMGSKFTSYERGMKVVLQFLYQNGLFFVDSKTTGKSVSCKLGKKLGWPVLKRDVFLDNTKNERYILNQLQELAKIALKKGYAIAIGHPHISTYRALVKGLPKLDKMGVKVVPIKRIFQGVLNGEFAGCI